MPKRNYAYFQQDFWDPPSVNMGRPRGSKNKRTGLLGNLASAAAKRAKKFISNRLGFKEKYKKRPFGTYQTAPHTDERYRKVGRKGKKNFSEKDLLHNLRNALQPKVRFEHRFATVTQENLSNQGVVTEHLLNSRQEMKLHFDKLTVEPAAPLGLTGFSGQTQLKYVYEGGQCTWTITNTASFTAYIEFRVMKNHVQAIGQGVPQNESPIRQWALDETNDVNGDSWHLQSASNAPTNAAANISSFTIAGSTLSRTNNYQINKVEMDAFIRPKKSSLRLHRAYDLESKVNYTLKPGETIHYTVQLPRFWQDGQSTIAADANEIQRYSRIVWLFSRGEMVCDTSTDTARMAPSSVQLHISKSTKHDFRQMLSTKAGYKIVSVATTGARGGFDDIDQLNEAAINEETNLEQTYVEAGLTNATAAVPNPTT